MKRMIQVLVCSLVMLCAGTAMSDERGVAKKNEPLFYNIRTEPGEHLSIQLQGDGDGDIDCYLYNTNGTLANKDNDSQDNCLIQGRADAYLYKLKVVNTGNTSSIFSLRVVREKPAKDI